jgi:hypothetical protein
MTELDDKNEAVREDSIVVEKRRKEGFFSAYSLKN